jgi:hypothetical protein
MIGFLPCCDEITQTSGIMCSIIIPFLVDRVTRNLDLLGEPIWRIRY